MLSSNGFRVGKLHYFSCMLAIRRFDYAARLILDMCSQEDAIHPSKSETGYGRLIGRHSLSIERPTFVLGDEMPPCNRRY